MAAVCLFGVLDRAECEPAERFSASPLSAYVALFDTLLGQHYAEAESLCAVLAEDWPGHPAVEYAWASVIYAQLCDYEDTTGTGELEQRVERCLELCGAWERRAPDSSAAEREFLTGSAYSVSGLTRHRQGKTVEGVVRLMTSRRHFDRAIKLDAGFYDAYVGRGAYRYAAASNLGFLRWLPGVPSKRAGWNDLVTGMQRSAFSRFPAMSAMVWLALDEKNWATADSMVRAGLARFPESRTFLMPKLALEKRTEQWDAARGTATILLNSYRQLENQNGYEVIGLYRSLMECSDMLGDSTAARSYAELGLAVPTTPYARERRTATLQVLSDRLERRQ